MKHKVLLSAVIIVGLVLLVFTPESIGKDFFQDKIIRIIAGYPPGGGVDTEARLVSRYLPKYIPGRPKFIVLNMPGAGGRIALNHASNIAKRDGLTWIVIPTSPNAFQILDKNRKFDLTEMIYLRGSSEPGATVIRDITGVKEPADLLKIDPKLLVMPGRSVPDAPQMALKAALDVLGVKSGYKASFGYAGTARITAALLQGEATFYTFALINVLKGGALSEPIEQGKAIPLWQSGVINSKGEVVRDERLDMPTFKEVYQKLTGKAPSGVAWQAYKAAGPAARTLNRCVLTTPGVPPDRVKIMRNAFDAMRKDPEYQTSIKRITGFEPETFPGELAQKLIKNHVESVTPEVLAYMRSIMK